jgi:transposase
VDTFRKVDTMSRMAKDALGRRVRRQFSEEFKEGAVRLVLDEGKTIGAVSRELDLTASALANWVKQARAERTQGKSGLMKEEREELTRLRKENRELRIERDLLKKVSALFAKHQA